MGAPSTGREKPRTRISALPGGDGCGLLFQKGEIIRKVPEEALLEELVKEIERM